MKKRIKAKVKFYSGINLSLEVLENNAKIESGQIVIVEVDDKRKNRTLDQNAFFHLMLGRMVEYFDNELFFFQAEYIPEKFKRLPNWKMEYLKFTLKAEYLTEYEEVEEGDTIITRPFIPSTTMLTVGEFCEFTEKCIGYFSESGAPIDAFLIEYENYKGKYF